jgi:ABC-2 type transport system ATP-binding protein
MQEVQKVEYVLQTKDLKKNYKNFQALDGVTMNVPKGSIYGFVGKNGAGKTTLFRQVCGLQKPTSGEYFIYGKSNKDKDIIKSRRRMGAVVETPAIYREMTAVDNLKEQYRILGLPSFDDIPELLKLVGLEHTGKKKVKHFSLGMRQRLGIAVALSGSPDFLMLDEPINGLDPEGIIEMRELILKLNRENGITVLISSHILDELSKIATHFGFIDKGKIIKEITAAELESECRKRTHIVVTDAKILSRILDESGLEHTILSDTEANIFGQVDITDLVSKLAARDCQVVSIQEQEENLESFFMNLVGGKQS